MKYKNNLSHDVMVQGPNSVLNVAPGQIIDLPDATNSGVLTLVIDEKPKKVAPKPKPKKAATPPPVKSVPKETLKTDLGE